MREGNPDEWGRGVLRYILKPFGVTRPEVDLMDEDWSAGEDLERYKLITGPSSARKMPNIGKPTTVVFHAVGYSKVFGWGEAIDLPSYGYHDAKYGDRWPWYFHVQVQVWIPHIPDAPDTGPLVSQRALGRIQLGGEFSELTLPEFESVRDTVLACPKVQRRSAP